MLQSSKTTITYRSYLVQHHSTSLSWRSTAMHWSVEDLLQWYLLILVNDKFLYSSLWLLTNSSFEGVPIEKKKIGVPPSQEGNLLRFCWSFSRSNSTPVRSPATRHRQRSSSYYVGVVASTCRESLPKFLIVLHLSNHLVSVVWLWILGLKGHEIPLEQLASSRDLPNSRKNPFEQIWTGIYNPEATFMKWKWLLHPRISTPHPWISRVIPGIWTQKHTRFIPGISFQIPGFEQISLDM